MSSAETAQPPAEATTPGHQRERREAKAFDFDEFEKQQKKVDPSKGKGAKLNTLPGWPSRTTDAFEKMLEPIHRIVLGRAGRLRERAEALGEFCGLAPEEEDKARKTLAGLQKGQLEPVIKMFSIPKSGNKQQEVADDVLKFLMCPAAFDKQKRTRDSTPKPQTTEKTATPARSEEDASSPPKKTPRVEKPKEQEDASSPPKKTPHVEKTKEQKEKKATSTAGTVSLSDEAITLAVFRHLLKLSAEQRSALSLGSVVRAIETHFKKSEGDLQSRKPLIKDAVSELLQSLKANSIVAVAQAPPAATPAAAAPVPEPAAPSSSAAPAPAPAVADPVVAPPLVAQHAAPETQPPVVAHMPPTTATEPAPQPAAGSAAPPA